tara:strand:- start:664 stop:858 length:195 start_codon:yes stop_codon:yes gene_type:complete
MLKYAEIEFDRDERDYRRFFQSRNISLGKMIKKAGNITEKNLFGKKDTLIREQILKLISKGAKN